MDNDRTIPCCIAIMAHNEEANIGRVLEAVLAQETKTVSVEEIVVVSSGSTDRTADVVRTFMSSDSRLRLIEQLRREGKASAINLLIRSTEMEVIVLHNADNLSLPNTIEALVSPFADPQVGMTGGRPVPINSPRTFMGYGVHLQWELHHQVSLRHPKMGELVAFRNIFRQIPYDSAVDEASIEPLILGQGLRIIYVPDAVVQNKGPETVRDFLKQRRRIYAGHMYVKDLVGYRVSTMKGISIAWLFLKAAHLDWRYFVWGPAIVLLEMVGRLWGAYHYKIWKLKPYAWPVVESTKDLAKDLGVIESTKHV